MREILHNPLKSCVSFAATYLNSKNQRHVSVSTSRGVRIQSQSISIVRILKCKLTSILIF